jgi:hypothetical protein
VILGRNKRVGALCDEEGVGKTFQPELCGVGTVLYGIAKKTGQFASVRGQKKWGCGGGDNFGIAGKNFQCPCI